MRAGPTSIRKRWGWRRIHKWLAVGAGVILTVWIVSGVVLAVPGGATPAFRQLRPEVDLRLATVSPAEAVAAAEAAEAAGARAGSVGSVTFELLGARPVYRVRVGGRGPVLVDATSGEVVEIDAAEALRIVRDLYGGSGSPSDPELVTGPSLRYFLGSFPAYRIEFDDEYGTSADVAVRNGTITWWDGRARSRRLMAAFHDWWPIGRMADQRLRMLLIVLASVLSLAATLTGYWLALRRKRRT